MGITQPDGEPFRGVAFNLSSLGYAVSKGFKDILGPFELHPREFAVLRAVGFQEGQTQQALGDRLQIPRSRMVSIVDELESRGFLERHPNPADRRVRELHLTAAGRKALDQTFAEALAFEQQVTSTLDPDEREQLLGLLDRISAHLGIGPGAHTALREDGAGEAS
ncbi:MAG TPA: MarR family transcriptional regulator [Gaiellaceae bacterium]|nr:MarR family transcriptional regulator [Gaiellaceae bacterium]